MNIRSSVGPNMDPCGTPERTDAKSANPVSLSIVCLRLLRYDLNQFKTEGVHFYNESFLNKML